MAALDIFEKSPQDPRAPAFWKTALIECANIVVAKYVDEPTVDLNKVHSVLQRASSIYGKIEYSCDNNEKLICARCFKEMAQRCSAQDPVGAIACYKKAAGIFDIVKDEADEKVLPTTSSGANTASSETMSKSRSAHQ